MITKSIRRFQHYTQYLYVILGMTVIHTITYGQEILNMELLSQIDDRDDYNDIWGYVDNQGREYAVIGSNIDTRIYDIQDPRNPVEVAILPGTRSIWRDFKTYRDYIYVTTDQGEDGLRIIDMTHPDEEVNSILYQDTITTKTDTDQLKRCHNLYIDTLRGQLYLAGCNVGEGGVLIFDIATDPLSPSLIGAIDERYSHDVVARGDTLFSSEINQGNLGIYDTSDPSAPQLISRTQTTSSFTHNAWFSDDGRYVFTTDERPNSNVDAYDISDITSPELIDAYQPRQNLNVIPHNTHYMNGYLYTSWYSEGIVIVDAHRPDNLVKVGQYDTFTGPDGGFRGCWGAYPYLPSGVILASDRTNGLFVLSADLPRAAYLEGTISDAETGAAINGVSLILSDKGNTSNISDAKGIYKTGTASGGTYILTISHPDYDDYEVEVTLENGEVTLLDIELFKDSALKNVVGQIIQEDGSPVPFAKALLILGQGRDDIELTADEDGYYKIILRSGSYDIYAASWSYRGAQTTINIPIDNSKKDILLDPIVLTDGYEDDFFVDLGWTVGGDATHGLWERGIPHPTFFNGQPSNPNEDIQGDLYDLCYMTGNKAAGSVGADDVDDGTTILTSPIIDISSFKNPIVSFRPWFFNAGGDSPINDTMSVYLLSKGDKMLIAQFVMDEANAGWREPVAAEIKDFFFRADAVQFSVEVSDISANGGHLVEGAIDQFRVYEGPLPTYPEEQPKIVTIAAPNPSVGNPLYIDALTDKAMIRLRVFDAAGRMILRLNRPTFPLDLSGLPSGVYVIESTFDNEVTSLVKWSKI